MLDEKWTLYMHIVPKELSGYDFDKYYIGITSKDIYSRWGKNGNGYHKQVFYNAIKKYGWDNIKHKIIYENLTKEDAFSLEKEFIKKYKSNLKMYGYNIASGGHSGGVSKNVAQYDLNGNLINVYGSVACASLECFNSEKNTGDISRACIFNGTSHGFMWRYLNNDVIQNKIPAYKDNRKKEILQFDIYGNFIREWSGVNEARAVYGSNCIVDVCKGKRKTSCGFQWKYKEDEKKIEDISKEVIRFKRIYVYSKDGQYINDYPGIIQACKKLGINKIIDISRYLLDIQNNFYKGYRWTDCYYKQLPPLMPRFTNLTKPVAQIDMNNNVINIFSGAKEASELTVANHSVIIGCCRGYKGCFSSGGYKWKYIQDITESDISDSFLLQKYNYYLEQINKRKEFKTIKKEE